MPPLLNHKGEPLIDAAGHVLTAGSLVRDEMFGEGIARGTVPLQRGEGVNVLIDWLGASPGEKPMSRRVACLTVVQGRAGGGGGAARTVRSHTGDQFESGDLRPLKSNCNCVVIACEGLNCPQNQPT